MCLCACVRMCLYVQGMVLLRRLVDNFSSSMWISGIETLPASTLGPVSSFLISCPSVALGQNWKPFGVVASREGMRAHGMEKCVINYNRQI